MKKKIFLLFLRLGISTGLILYFIIPLTQEEGGLKTAFYQFYNTLTSDSFQWLILAFFLHIVGFTLTTLRWKVLLKAQGVQAKFFQLFTFYLLGTFFNIFLPAPIGGDTVRAITSKKITGSTTTSFMVVIIERFTGVIAMVLIATTGLIIMFFTSIKQDTQAWMLLALAIAGFVFIILMAHPRIASQILKITKKILPTKIQAFLEKAYQAVEVYYRHPQKLFLAQFISIVFQSNVVIYFYIVARALNQSPDPVEFMIKMPIVLFLLTTIPTINGIGIRTAGFKGLLGFKNIHALAVESIDLGFRIIYGLFGGLIYLIYRLRNRNDNPS
jgi:uncharacterized protein (TIRG00374 family)